MKKCLQEKDVAIRAVLKASSVCQVVFNNLVLHQSITKVDHSPVTVADFASQAIINFYLHEAFPDDIIIAEEDSATLFSESSQPTIDIVLNLVRSALGNELITEGQLFEYLDYGRKETISQSISARCWTVDPIDGTKGFLRGEQYAICVSLIEHGIINLAILGCPNYVSSHANLTCPGAVSEQRGLLFYAIRGHGAFEKALLEDKERKLCISAIVDPKKAILCESFEGGHSSHAATTHLSQTLGILTPPLRMDSQCKYAAVARGDASIYVRVPPNPDYREWIWDHAPGALLVHEAGGIVTDIRGKALDFTQMPRLLENFGIIATNGGLYDNVKRALT